MSDLLPTAHTAPRPYLAEFLGLGIPSGFGVMASAAAAGLVTTMVANVAGAGPGGLTYLGAALAAAAFARVYQRREARLCADRASRAPTIALLRRLRDRLQVGAFASRHGGAWIVFETEASPPRMMTSGEYREFRMTGLVNEVVVGRHEVVLRRLWNGAEDSAHTGAPAIVALDPSTGRLLRRSWCLQGIEYGHRMALQAHDCFKTHHEAPTTFFMGDELTAELP